MWSSIGGSSIQVSRWLTNSAVKKCLPVLPVDSDSVSGKNIPIPYTQGLCPREVCRSHRVLRLGFKILQEETETKEKKNEKGTLGVENAGGVSLTCGMFSKLLYGTSFSTWKKK